MANSGTGTKFASVNLNKSYGQSSSHHHHHHYHAANSGSSGSNRARPGIGGGGGGGMVVLSRPRSSQKTGSKLSVPPPLNLPSLRKEHERFDPTGSGGGHASSGIPGSGLRPSSSVVGWTKPTSVALHEKEGFITDHLSDGTDHNGDGIGKGSNGVYMPPSVRLGGMGPLISSSSLAFPSFDKAIVLKGEDFPSLHAALPTVSGPEKKQKDDLNQKQKQMVVEESFDGQREGSHSSSLVKMHPQLQSGSERVHNVLSESGQEDHCPSISNASGKARKQDDCYPGPLPLVRLNPRSDWADDERDVSHSFTDQRQLTDRGRDHLHSKADAYWDSDFDIPRTSMLPHRPVHGLVNRWRQHDNEIGKASSCEVSKMDSYGRDVRTASREGPKVNSWRASSPLSRDGFGSKEAVLDRNEFAARPSGMNKERDNKYIPLTLQGSGQDDAGRRDFGHGQGGRQPWNNPTDSFISQGSDVNTREPYGSEQSNRYKSDAFQNSSVSKLTSIGSKGLPMNNSILNFGREKRPFSKNEKLYAEDTFMKDFGATSLDGQGPFPASLVGVVKRKKDLLKQTDFHDPVRESFEAELERVQKMQEQERQRIIEEQERALELARREEEERMRLLREQEELKRRLEEEAREAAWRAEQEQLEAMRRADEHRIAREEEKRRILMEEERRKHAAKQKLLELEERIAKRQAESTKSGVSSAVANERDLPKAVDAGDWEDGERMVERITTSVSSDSSSLNRPFETSSRPHLSQDVSSKYSGGGKPVNSWRRDTFENGSGLTFVEQDAEQSSLRREESVGGRTYSRKELYGGAGFTSARSYYRAGMPEPHMDDFGHPRNQRWNVFGDADHYVRNAEIGSEFQENLAENYGDAGWGQRSRSNAYSPYPERYYQNPEGDGLYSFGSSRYSMRQPRVPPPPSLFTMQKTSHRGENEQPGPSSFQEHEILYNNETRSVSVMDRGYDSGQKDSIGHPRIIDVQSENAGNVISKLDGSSARCDSQSSVSVSSPPDSPIHLSHDDLDESGDSAVLLADHGKEFILSGQVSEPCHLPPGAGKEKFSSATNSISAADDEEWNDNNNELQEQEEYDEDEEGYQDEDEVREGGNGNIDLTQEFEDMHLEQKDSEQMVDNLVLGFNEGVEVAMPNDEFEKNSANEDTYAISQMSSGNLEENGSVDGRLDGSTIFQETDRMPDLVIQANNTPQTPLSSELQEQLDASGNTCMSAQKALPSSINMASHSSSGQSALSPASTVQDTAEVPVKLQFGLFSGPSLIPSPVPAIQIGSIQMPLHLHSQGGASLTHMHSSQPPLFQFGQLRYASPVSQGLLPFGPQSMPFAQPNVPANFSLNQSCDISLPVHSVQENSTHVVKEEVSSLLGNQSIVTTSLDLPPQIVPKEDTLAAVDSGKAVVPQQGAVEVKNIDDSSFKLECGFKSEYCGHNSALRNFKSTSIRESGGQPQTAPASTHSVFMEKELSLPKAQGHTYGGRSKKHAFTAKNSNSRSFPAPEVSRHDSFGYQKRSRHLRMEFRIRENAEKNQSTGMVSSYQPTHLMVDDKSEANGRSGGYFTKNGGGKVVTVNKSKTNEAECSVSASVTSQEIDYGNRPEKGTGKETLLKGKKISKSGDNNIKRNFEKDMDGTLQSGVVRVFEQPGIEAPSDEDDFIEVRSKRQMLNNRREQREKEIKAKSRNAKLLRKASLTSQSVAPSANSIKTSATATGAINGFRTEYVGNERQNLAGTEVSAGYNATIGSKSLADQKTQTVKSMQNPSLPASSRSGPNLVPGIMFESESKVLDNVPVSLSSWSNSGINKQVMLSKQNQPNDSSKPVQFDSRSSIGDHTTSVHESSMPASSILIKEKPFASAASPVNSLLAGEKIQFGAVTSPTVLPKSSHVHGIGPPGPCRSEIQMSPSLSSIEKGCTFFFEKEKQSCETSGHLEDSEAEAEAAASAIAVAAITSDEMVGNGMGSCPVSGSETQSFGGVDIDGISTGVAGDQQLASQSKVEDSLSVSLPADLSVENPPISLWPPIPSPQNSSGQMISHFPGGPPSHYPFYEMNHMLGGPMFAFGPHEESTSTQLQSQKSSAPSSSPLATWQQCHSGVDSFYGPPAGFNGPFIGPPGGIPGVQAPPHMVVYNHFAPVGQFGQLGLSFMGATYIPSGKQPDWKHTPTSAMSVSEGEMNSMNMASSQRNSSSMPTPMQHLAPGSPLMPVASPLALFDVSPFQSSPDASVQPCWSHVPPSSLPPALNLPLHQQAEGIRSSQYNQGHAIDKSSAVNRFPESRSSTPTDSSCQFPVTTDATLTQLPDELGLAETSGSMITGASIQTVATKVSSVSTVAYPSKVDINNRESKNNGQGSSSAFKSPSVQQKRSQHYSNSPGNNHQRGDRVPQKSSSGDWSHRRMGFQARNSSLGSDKSFSASKVKQIYVAKQTTNGSSTLS